MPLVRVERNIYRNTDLKTESYYVRRMVKGEMVTLGTRYSLEEAVALRDASVAEQPSRQGQLTDAQKIRRQEALQKRSEGLFTIPKAFAAWNEGDSVIVLPDGRELYFDREDVRLNRFGDAKKSFIFLGPCREEGCENVVEVWLSLGQELPSSVQGRCSEHVDPEKSRVVRYDFQKTKTAWGVVWSSFGMKREDGPMAQELREEAQRRSVVIRKKLQWCLDQGFSLDDLPSGWAGVFEPDPKGFDLI